MHIRLIKGALSLLLFFSFAASSEVDPLQVWTASGGEARLELRADYLPDFGLEIVHEGRAAIDVVEIRRGFTESDHLIIEAPYGNFEGFVGGEIRLDTGWVLSHEGREVRLDGLTLTTGMYRNGHPSLEARDAAGRHLLTFHHIHLLTEHEQGLMTLHNMDVSGEPALAELLEMPVLRDMVLGMAWLDMPLHIPEGADISGIGVDTSGRGLSCANRPFWPQDFEEHGEMIDVAMWGIGHVAYQGTDGSTGRVKVAPDATLKNLSLGDVPWIPKFSSLGGQHAYPFSPPDQHPFLVWNMYRIVDGRIQQLGASGVKHAFLTLNFNCDLNCSNGRVLWPGCEDVYGAGTNNSNSNQGPREDIIASEGLFFSTCSFFDPGCVGSQTNNSGNFENRLMVDPNQFQTPGANYYLDAWYVIQYDIDIWNSMAYHRITPTPSGGTGWTFPIASPFTVGRVLDEWVDPDNLGSNEDHAAIVVPSATPGEPYPDNMPQGHINVAVKVTEPEPGRYRYNYAVQNFDFDRGIEAFRIPIGGGAQIFETFFGGVDGEPGDDWTITVEDGFVNFEAPENNPLGWFKLFNFEIETDAPPVQSQVTLDLGGHAVVPSVDADILGPERGPAPIPGDVSLEPAFPGVPNFNFPVALRHAGDGSGRNFIVERNGFIRIIDAQGNLLPDPFLNITAQVDTFFEGGLLGLAFHPDFPNNGKFYVNFTSSGLTTRIAEFEVDSTNPDLADPSSQLNILSIPQPAGNHNGGDIHFGPDGYLYIGMGDGGPSGHGQNLNTLLGAMLRIDIDGDDFPGDPNRNYAIPADNPFVGVTGEDEIWSYGLRNPYRWSFDRDTGDMWVADVGQSTWEEVNLEPAGGSGGDNYGWNVCEASWQTGSTTIPCPLAGSTLPVLEYRNSGTNNCSVTGGYRYRGPFPSLQGWYIYGDYCSGRVWLAQEAGGDWIADEFDNVGFGIVGFGEDEAGHLYLLRSNGQILRFEGDPGDPDPAPVVTSVVPGSGPETGGTAVTVSGEDFQPGASVTFGANGCDDTVVVGGTEITCVTPPGPVGSVDVTVINPDSQGDTLTDGFTYLEVVDPVPALTLSDGSLDFGPVQVGDQSGLDVELQSTGTATLEVSGLDLPDVPFSVDGSDCGVAPFELDPGEHCTLAVTFAPGTAGEFTGEIVIASNADSSPDTVALAGTGEQDPDPGVLDVAPAALPFGEVSIGDSGVLSVTVSNIAAEGSADLELTLIAVIAGAEAFAIDTDSSDCGASLAAQASCTVVVEFSPAAAQAYSGVLRIIGGDTTVNVSLSGRGVQPPADIFEDRFEELALLLRGALIGW